jgi:hypothetical protein
MHTTQQAGEATWEALKSQVMRLGQLDGYPQPEYKPEAFRELVVALQNADSLEDAHQFIDDVMMCELICPKPSQLRDMIRSVRESRGGNKPAEFQPDFVPPVQRMANWPKDSDERFNRHLELLKQTTQKKLHKDHPARIELRELTAELKAAYPQLLNARR